jgi:hypothetical protein
MRLRPLPPSPSHRVPRGLLALGESPCSHVVLHHGALLELMLDGVCMVRACCLKELFDVIGRLPHPALEVTLSGSDVFHVRIISLLIASLVIASSKCDLLRVPLWPPLIAFGAPLHSIDGGLG